MSKRIENKVSRTAGGVCTVRAVSSYENFIFKSDDHIARIFCPPFLNWAVKISAVRTFFKNHVFPRGGYEYLIARTKLIDEVFKKHSRSFEQVLILGAGFDSRAIRFKSQLQHATVFELDAPITQKAKTDRLRRKKIELPANVRFLPINFNKDLLPQKLAEAGFKKDLTCLFLLEGITMYLSQEAIDATFSLIREYSGKNSLLVFDYVYASALRQENIYYGEKEHYRAFETAGEHLTFGIERGQVKNFLAQYNFELLDELDADRSEKQFFTDKKGKLLGRVTGMFSIVTARKR